MAGVRYSCRKTEVAELDRDNWPVTYAPLGATSTAKSSDSL